MKMRMTCIHSLLPSCHSAFLLKYYDRLRQFNVEKWTSNFARPDLRSGMLACSNMCKANGNHNFIAFQRNQRGVFLRSGFLHSLQTPYKLNRSSNFTMTSTPNTNENREVQVSAPTKVFGNATASGSNIMSSPLVTFETREPFQHENEASTPTSASTENDESEEDRLRREEDESIALARAFMAEEAMAVSYQMSSDYLRANRDQFSEEDLAALQAAMEEDEQEAHEAHGVVEDEDGTLSYDLMLRLGETMGDVKSERWAQVAQAKIEKLETFKFNPENVCGMDENDCGVKCLVCQFAYEKDEDLRKLPCEHCFHSECVDQWLQTKDCCPYCRTAIVKEESA
jgi:hypothetical protein